MFAFGDMTIWQDSNAGISTTVAFLISLVIILGVCTALGMEWLQNKYYDYKRNRPTPTNIEYEAKVRQPSLIMEYYRAFKGKYCPQIEFN